MKYTIHDFINSKGLNEFNTWAKGLQKYEKAKLREKLDKLILHGDDLHPQMLSDTPVPGIQKLRVHGPVQLRPLLCKGPLNIDEEYTMLMGAKEIGSKWSPKDAPKSANGNKNEIISDPVNRRKKHERFT
jgi:hypothetical protein